MQMRSSTEGKLRIKRWQLKQELFAECCSFSIFTSWTELILEWDRIYPQWFSPSLLLPGFVMLPTFTQFVNAIVRCMRLNILTWLRVGSFRWAFLYINQTISLIYFSNLLFSAANLPGFTSVYCIYHFVHYMLAPSKHSLIYAPEKTDRQAIYWTSAELSQETYLGFQVDMMVVA